MKVRESSDSDLEILEWMDENTERQAAFIEQVFGLWDDVQTAAHDSRIAHRRRRVAYENVSTR